MNHPGGESILKGEGHSAAVCVVHCVNKAARELSFLLRSQRNHPVPPGRFLGDDEAVVCFWCTLKPVHTGPSSTLHANIWGWLVLAS